MELDLEKTGSSVRTMSPQTAILGGPVADARSWPASGYNLVATEETLILGGSEYTLTDTCLAWLALAGSVSNRDEQEMGEGLRAGSQREEENHQSRGTHPSLTHKRCLDWFAGQCEPSFPILV